MDSRDTLRADPPESTTPDEIEIFWQRFSILMNLRVSFKPLSSAKKNMVLGGWVKSIAYN
jgi:hypothetical protein